VLEAALRRAEVCGKDDAAPVAGARASKGPRAPRANSTAGNTRNYDRPPARGPVGDGKRKCRFHEEGGPRWGGSSQLLLDPKRGRPPVLAGPAFTASSSTRGRPKMSPLPTQSRINLLVVLYPPPGDAQSGLPERKIQNVPRPVAEEVVRGLAHREAESECGRDQLYRVGEGRSERPIAADGGGDAGGRGDARLLGDSQHPLGPEASTCVSPHTGCRSKHTV
jgi:hypothetical protein